MAVEQLTITDEQLLDKLGSAREELLRDGTPHAVLAHRMVALLSGHDLVASAPSWDGKWLSALLRAAGLPRHTLRLRDTEEVQRETARNILETRIAAEHLESEIERVRKAAIKALPKAATVHRALADAQAEYRRWLAVRDAAEQFRGATSNANDAKIRIHASIIDSVR